MSFLILAPAALVGVGSGAAVQEGPTSPARPAYHTDHFPGGEAIEAAAIHEYQVDPAHLKDLFRASSTVTFLSPPDGVPLTVAGRETDLFTSRDLFQVSAATGPVKVGKVTAIPLQGRTLDGIAADARLTLGEWGIHGIVDTADGRYALEPRAPGVQVVAYYEGDFLRDTLEELADGLRMPQHSLSTTTVSNTWIHTDTVGKNAKPNWQDIVTSAFNQHKTAWSSPSNLKIDLRISSMWEITDRTISSTGDCSNTGIKYDDFLTWYFSTFYGPWNHQAHQFWNGRAMTGGYGCALPDTLGYANPDAHSVVSLVDIGTDYDIDNLNHRAIMSAHEFGHIYGVPSTHFYETNALGKYEIMASGMPLNSVELFFGTSSRSHMHCRFYHGNEPTCS